MEKNTHEIVFNESESESDYEIINIYPSNFEDEFLTLMENLADGHIRINGKAFKYDFFNEVDANVIFNIVRENSELLEKIAPKIVLDFYRNEMVLIIK